jgi:hypothetical protein
MFVTFITFYQKWPEYEVHHSYVRLRSCGALYPLPIHLCSIASFTWTFQTSWLKLKHFWLVFRDTDYHDWNSFSFSSAPPGECLGYYFRTCNWLPSYHSEATPSELLTVLWHNRPMRELIKFRNLKEWDCATVAERCSVLPPLPSSLFAPRVARLHGNTGWRNSKEGPRNLWRHAQQYMALHSPHVGFQRL